MLTEVEAKLFRHYFPSDPHPFISERFIELNQGKAERIIRLIPDGEKPNLGLTAGIRDGIIRSPFSAPFGGFHFRNESVYIHEIDEFLSRLQEYAVSRSLSGIEVILPPGLYNPTFNSKMTHCMLRQGFQTGLPDITSWVNLQNFSGEFSQRNSREYYRQAVRNGLKFRTAGTIQEMESVYELIRLNRTRFGRPIFMRFNDVIDTSRLWPADFFQVLDPVDTLVASGIFYRSHPEIVYALFWGDSEAGRPLRAMDFLAHQVWNHYKNIGFKYIDLGISTESGIPNEGLLRFKESHEAVSSLRYRFSWQVI